MIVPPGLTLRTRLLFPSIGDEDVPSPSIATPSGAYSFAEVAGPPSPEKPGLPVPAIVVIVPPDAAPKAAVAATAANAVRHPASKTLIDLPARHSWSDPSDAVAVDQEALSGLDYRAPDADLERLTAKAPDSDLLAIGERWYVASVTHLAPREAVATDR